MQARGGLWVFLAVKAPGRSVPFGAGLAQGGVLLSQGMDVTAKPLRRGGLRRAEGRPAEGREGELAAGDRGSGLGGPSDPTAPCGNETCVSRRPRLPKSLQHDSGGQEAGSVDLSAHPQR